MPKVGTFLSFTSVVAAYADRSPGGAATMAQEIAAAADAGKIGYRLAVSAYPDAGDGAWGQDPREEDFFIELGRHFRRVGMGLEAPDFERLTFVGIERDDAASYIESRFPQVRTASLNADAQAVESGGAGGGGDKSKGSEEYQTLQKILAVVTILVARETGCTRSGGAPNIAGIHTKIETLLKEDTALREQIGTTGLSAQNVSRHISAALKVFNLAPD